MSRSPRALRVTSLGHAWLQHPCRGRVEVVTPGEHLHCLQCGDEIRALDTESSASRQHWIETGEFLKAGEAFSV